MKIPEDTENLVPAPKTRLTAHCLFGRIGIRVLLRDFGSRCIHREPRHSIVKERIPTICRDELCRPRIRRAWEYRP